MCEKKGKWELGGNVSREFHACPAKWCAITVQRLWNIIHPQVAELIKRMWEARRTIQVPRRTFSSSKSPSRKWWKSNWKRYLLRTTLDSINGSVNPILEPCESLFHRPRQISTTNWMSSVHFKWRLVCPILCNNLLHIDVRLREDNAWVSLSSTYHTINWTFLDRHSDLAPISSSGSEYARLQVDS